MFVEGAGTTLLSSSLDGDGASREDVGVFATATKVDIDINLLAHSSAVGNGGPWQSSDETDMAGLLIRSPSISLFHGIGFGLDFGDVVFNICAR